MLQVVLSLNPGGTERLVLDLVLRLHDETPMMVCCLDEEGAWADQLRARGIEVHALGRQPGFDAGLGRKIAALVRRHRADVIHAHHYSPFVYAAVARLFTPATRIVFTEHGRISDGPPSPKRWWVNRVLFSHAASAVFAVSDDLRQHMVKEGWSASQVKVLYNGITPGPALDPGARDIVRGRIGAAESDLVIGTIARLDPVKDLGTLLDAIARLNTHRVTRLVIVGDGPERSMLETRAATLGITDRVTFLGQRNDAREWLAGCDLFVNCSTSEGVSLTILEAMAAALPVIVTAVGGTPEVVTPETGRLIPARDASALANAALTLGSDQAHRAALGTAARERVQTRFTLDRMIGEYRAAYFEVL